MDWIERGNFKHGAEYKRIIDRLPAHLVDAKWLATNERPTVNETVSHFRERQNLLSETSWQKWIENDLTVLRSKPDFISNVKDKSWADVFKLHDQFLETKRMTDAEKSKEKEKLNDDNVQKGKISVPELSSKTDVTKSDPLNGIQALPADIKVNTVPEVANLPIASNESKIKSDHYKRKDETWPEILREESEELYNLTHKGVFDEHTLLEYIDVLFIFKFIPKDLLKSAFNLHLEKCKKKNYDTKIQEEWAKNFLT